MPLRYDYLYTPVEPPVHPSQASKFIWTSAAGVITDLANFDDPNSGICVPPGAIGIGMPAFEYYETESPVFDGSSVRGWRSPARDIQLPIQMWGKDRLDLLARWRKFVRDIKPSILGPGTLTLRRYDGESRDIQCFYTGGLEGADDDEAWGMYWIKAVVTLHCPSPFWTGEELSQNFGSTGDGDGGEDPGEEPAPTEPLFFPIGPVVRLAGGQALPTPDPDEPDNIVIGTLRMTNQGDAITYPVITLTGPCDQITLTNKTTGQFFTVLNGVVAGHALVIDTREGARTVIEYTVPAGTSLENRSGPLSEVVGVTVVGNRYGSLAGGSELWPLIEGENLLEISVPGLNSDTHLLITYKQRFHTGY